jgi:hypothetical protein
VKHLRTSWVRATDNVLSALRVTATVWADVNGGAINVVKQMVIAIETGDLLGGPYREHFRTSV